MAGGNRYKHRTSGGDLVPNKQQQRQNNFYTPPEKDPTLSEILARLVRGGSEAIAGTGLNAIANARPTDTLTAITQPGGVARSTSDAVMNPVGKHLWDNKFGLVPAGKAIDATSTLIDVLSGREKSIPFAPAKSGELAGDAVNNAGLAALDASTLVPGWGIVPKMKIGPKPPSALIDALTEAPVSKALKGEVREYLLAGKNPVVLTIGDGNVPEISWRWDGYGPDKASIGDVRDAYRRVLSAAAEDSAQTGTRAYKFQAGSAGDSEQHKRLYDSAIKTLKDPTFKVTPGNERYPYVLQRKLFATSPKYTPPTSPTTLGMGVPFGGKDGEKPLLNALIDALRGRKPEANPLDQFTPPASIDDIFTGGTPRGPREVTGGAENPAGLEGSFMNDPRFNGPQEPVPYNPESGFGGLDARLGQQKPLGYDDWSPEWRAAYDKGLDMSTEARMARAKEQGFVVPLFRGSASENIPDLVWTTPSPDYAAQFPMRTSGGDRFVMPLLGKDLRLLDMTKYPEGVEFDDAASALGLRRSQDDALQRVETFYGPMGDLPATHDFLDDDVIINAIKENNYSGVRDTQSFNGTSGEGRLYFDPANIRSTSAAFDPDNIGKPTLLGMGVPSDDLLKILMALGAFGGGSAGALATVDAQKNAQRPGM